MKPELLCPVGGPRQLKAALRFGADVVIDPNTQSVVTEALTLSGGIGYDAVIEASGDRKSAAITMNLVAPSCFSGFTGWTIIWS